MQNLLNLLLVPAFCSALLPVAFAQTQSSVGDAKRGKSVFIADGCAECHGTGAEGGVGPHLAPSPLPSAAIAAYIRHPAGVMPPYAASTVSDADIADIYAYLRSLPDPPTVKCIPELND